MPRFALHRIESWTDVLHAQSWQAAASHTVESRFHADLSQTLLTLGVAHRKEVMSDDNVFSLDIVLAGHRVAVEADGPYHFTVNTKRPTGESFLSTLQAAEVAA